MTLTCFSKECGKARFLDYYVCAEHFLCYAAPRYVEPMALQAEPMTYSAIAVFAPEAACSLSRPEHAARQYAEV